MIEKIKGFYHEVQPSAFAHRKVFKCAQIKIDEARCAYSVSRKTERARRNGKCAASFLVASGQCVDWSSTAKSHDWRDFDVAQDFAQENVFLIYCPLLFFLTKGKIEERTEHESMPDILTRKAAL